MDLPALNSLSSQRPLTDEAVTEEVHHNAVRESLMKDKGQADIIRVANHQRHLSHHHQRHLSVHNLLLRRCVDRRPHCRKVTAKSQLRTHCCLQISSIGETNNSTFFRQELTKCRKTRAQPFVTQKDASK